MKSHKITSLSMVIRSNFLYKLSLLYHRTALLTFKSISAVRYIQNVNRIFFFDQNASVMSFLLQSQPNVALHHPTH